MKRIVVIEDQPSKVVPGCLGPSIVSYEVTAELHDAIKNVLKCWDNGTAVYPNSIVVNDLRNILREVGYVDKA